MTSPQVSQSQEFPSIAVVVRFVIWFDLVGAVVAASAGDTIFLIVDLVLIGVVLVLGVALLCVEVYERRGLERKRRHAECLAHTEEMEIQLGMRPAPLSREEEIALRRRQMREERIELISEVVG